MSKKHFEWAARYLREYNVLTRAEHALIREFLVRLFGEFNGRFDRERFRAACERKP